MKLKLKSAIIRPSQKKHIGISGPLCVTIFFLAILLIPKNSFAAVTFPPCYDVSGTVCWLNSAHTGNGTTDAREYTGTYPVFGAALSATTTGNFDSLNGTTGAVYPGFWFMDYGSGDYRVYQYDASGTPEDIINSTTRIISFDPSYNEIVTPTVGQTGDAVALFYVNGEEWDSDIRYIGTMYYHNANGVVSPVWQTEHGRNAPGTVPSYNTWATTSLPFNIEGRYTWNVKICRREGFWVFETCSDIITASSTQFYVGTSTGPYTNAQITIQNKLDSLFASTTYNITANCNPLGGFDMPNCLMGIFFPGQEVFQEDLLLMSQLPPWGYAFRLYDILKTETATSLPMIVYKFGTTSPLYGALGGNSTYTLDPFGALSASTSPLLFVSDQETQKSIWDILKPAILLGIYLNLGFMIVNDITKLT